jgi:hypothetical protein
VDLGALSVLHMAGKGQGNSGGASGKAGKSTPKASPKGPGQWKYEEPTTRSKNALDYQEQITGRPAWWVYMVGLLEFDGFNGVELLEAKGPGYLRFFNPDGTPKYWYVKSGKFNQMMDQARKQSKAAEQLGFPVVWHVADAKVAEFLRKLFTREKLDNTTVHYTPAR